MNNPNVQNDIFTAGWSSYVSMMFVPSLFFLLGAVNIFEGKEIINIEDCIISFVLPFLAVILCFLIFYYNRLEISDQTLTLMRFILFRMKIETIIVKTSDVTYGILANNYGVKQAIMRRSGLQIVPVSVLYLEYTDRNGHAQKIAFNISMYDNKKLRHALAHFPLNDRTHYGNFPSI